MKEKIKTIIKASIETKQKLLANEELVTTIGKVAEVISMAFQHGDRKSTRLNSSHQ